MKTILSPIIIFLFAVNNLFAQDTISLCAQVNQDGLDVSVDIFVSNFANVGSLQLGVGWETSKYTFDSIDNIDPSIASIAHANVSSITPNLPDGLDLLNVVWFDDTAINPVSLGDESLLFTVKLTQNDPNISGLIGIAPNEDFYAEFGSGEGEILLHEIAGPTCEVLAFSSFISSAKDVIVNELVVSPNPFVEEVRINLNETSSGSFLIYAVTGKLVEQYNYKNKQEVTLSLESLRPGTYILTQKSEDGQVLGQSKIVKL